MKDLGHFPEIKDSHHIKLSTECKKNPKHGPQIANKLPEKE
jgi:hypothetical protein